MSLPADVLIHRPRGPFHPCGQNLMDYYSCLESLWAGQTEKACSEVAFFLSEDADHPQKFPLYRLWIESLAERQASSQLEELGQHFLTRGRFSEDFESNVWRALRGLVHLELDQIDAARLIFDGLGDADDPYTLEFKQVCAQRGMDEINGEILYLMRSPSRLFDYFQQRRLFLVLVKKGLTSDADLLLEHLSRSYPTSPLAAWFGYHRALEGDDYVEALDAAENLVQAWPSNEEFQLNYAWAAMKCRDFGGAKARLEGVMGRGTCDADVLSLMGYCLMETADGLPSVLSHAKKILMRAEDKYRDAGLPYEHIRWCLSSVREQLGDAGPVGVDLVTMRLPRKWLLELTPGGFAEYRENRGFRFLEQVMPESAQKGDLVFVAGRRSLTSDEWMVAGVHMIATEPDSDGVRRQCTLERLVDFDRVVDFSMTGSTAELGTTELEDKDIERLTASLKEKNAEFGEENEFVGYLEKLRQIS